MILNTKTVPFRPKTVNLLKIRGFLEEFLREAYPEAYFCRTRGTEPARNCASRSDLRSPSFTLPT